MVGCMEVLGNIMSYHYACKTLNLKLAFEHFPLPDIHTSGVLCNTEMVNEYHRNQSF